LLFDIVLFFGFLLGLNSRFEVLTVELQFAVLFISGLPSAVRQSRLVVDLFAFLFCTLPIPIGQLVLWTPLLFFI